MIPKLKALPRCSRPSKAHFIPARPARSSMIALGLSSRHPRVSHHLASRSDAISSANLAGNNASAFNLRNKASSEASVPRKFGHACVPDRPCPALNAQAGLGPVANLVESEENNRDASVAPLRMALESAKTRLAEITAERNELETRAQAVAEQAYEAEQAVRAAKDAVFDYVALIDAVKRRRSVLIDRIPKLQEVVGTNPDDPYTEENKELALATAELVDLDQELETLRSNLEQEYSKAVEVEAAYAAAESVAAEAMKAATAAVKEELQAATVLKETMRALEKSTVQVQDEAAMEGKGSAEGVRGLAMASMDQATGEDGAAAGNKGNAKDQIPAKRATGADEGLGWMMPVAALGVAVAGCWYLMNTASGVSMYQQFIHPVVELASSTNLGQAALDVGTAASACFTEVFEIVKEKVVHFHVHEAEESLWEAIVLLLSSCICVPLVVSKIPGGNPVLGYLLGGALVGPHALGIIQDVASVQHFAELGVVFLLFNIGLELSLERLGAMAKQVFGMGSLQVAFSLIGVLLAAHALIGLPVPSGVILGGALAMSSTAVGIKVLEDRGETGSRHGRAIFSVLLFQDLAVVILLMLIPLLAPSPDGSAVSGTAIAKALGMAAVKAVACIGIIIAGGRLIIQPIFEKINSFANANLFSVLTLLICLGTSLLTSMAGLSLALGAFLAGLLIAETEFANQVENDIAPYKGLLLGLFFMSVGMEISVQLFIARWKEVLGGIILLVGGKLAVMSAIGPMFGLKKLTALRAGLLLAPGGEFAFVAFGEAISRGVLPVELTSVLYLVVALSMALIPYLSTLGGAIGKALESSSTRAMQPNEIETKGLKNHVIICGYGRHGKVVAQVLSENYIPFVALDFSLEAVQAGRAQDLPVYFGDAGSPAVMSKLGAERAACAIISLDSPGANYRAVWAMTKHYPNVKTYVRAHDMSHALNLEKAGATVVVPATLEPTLQLAASILSTMNFSNEDVTTTIDEYRRNHTKELSQYTSEMGTTLGYGYGQTKEKKKEKETAIDSLSLASVSGI